MTLPFDRDPGSTYRARTVGQRGSMSNVLSWRCAALSARTLLLGGLAVAAVALPLRVSAQDAEEGGDTAVQKIADEGVSSATFGNIDASKVPTDEKKTRTEEMLVDQRRTLARVTEILTEARGSKDIVQLNCVNEKLTQVKGLLKISEQASLEMYEAIGNGAQDLVNHEYTKIVVAHQKSEVLGAEAEQCVGESSVYAGDTSVDVEVDESVASLPDGPSVGAAPPPGPAVPPVASFF